MAAGATGRQPRFLPVSTASRAYCLRNVDAFALLGSRQILRGHLDGSPALEPRGIQSVLVRRRLPVVAGERRTVRIARRELYRIPVGRGNDDAAPVIEGVA